MKHPPSTTRFLSINLYWLNLFLRRYSRSYIKPIFIIFSGIDYTSTSTPFIYFFLSKLSRAFVVHPSAYFMRLMGYLNQKKMFLINTISGALYRRLCSDLCMLPTHILSNTEMIMSLLIQHFDLD